MSEHAAAPATSTALSLPVDHPTAVMFLDETGVVHAHPRNPLFGIGVLKLTDPASVLYGMQLPRDRHHFRGELHWATFDKARARDDDSRIAFAKEVMDLFFSCESVRFCCHIADRQHGDLAAQFKGHPHAGERAYEHLASNVLREMIDEQEIVSILADRRSASPKVAFERDVTNSVNRAKGRLAIASVCRIDSRSTDALQLVDLLLGAATLDLRQGRTESGSQKQQLLEHLLKRCDCASFRPGGREDPLGRWKVKLLTRSRKARRKRRG